MGIRNPKTCSNVPCHLCGTELADRVATEAHLILAHPLADLALKETVDRFVSWYYLVFAKANPVAKPPGVKGVHWKPLVWGAVEMRYGIARKLDIIPYRPLHPGSIADVGMTILTLVGMEDPARVRRIAGYSYNNMESTASLAFTWGRAAGDWIWEKLQGNSWGVIPKVEIEQWLVSKLARK